MLASQTQLLKRLTAALGAGDPEQALSEAARALADFGLQLFSTTSQTTPESAWLEVELGARKLVVTSVGDTPDETTRDLVGPLLRLALLRAQEHDECTRVRERLDMFSSASFEGLIIHTEGMVIDVNERMSELSGYPREELLGPRALDKCIAPEDLQFAYDKIASRYEGTYLLTGVRKDGTRFRAELQSKQSKLGDRLVRVVAARDVTERERAVALLHETETRLRDLAHEAFDLVVLSRKGIVVDIDARVEAFLGHTRDQVIGRELLDYVAPSSQALVKEIIAEQRPGRFEAKVLDSRGEPVPVEIVGVMSSLHGEPVRVAGLRDLREAHRLEAEREKLEQQLVRSQRLESLGVLAGGIAHDFNNLLVGILGNAELLSERVRDSLDQTLANEIHVAGKRAADLVKQMLAYAGRRDVFKKEPVDVGQLLRELHSLLGATLSKKATVRHLVAPGSVVLGDRATISQVLMNLLTNASDALGDRAGTIEVLTARLHEPDSRWDDALGATVRPGAWVLLEVRDDGAGMDAETRSRVFEPFFTTKERGHGLGLAACLGIVAAHGGAIRVESDIGKGSRFSVLLPASELGAPALREVPARAAHRPCKVLVVDDEAMVRSQVRRSLELRGYTVEEASGGYSAVAAGERASADVILLDMTMHDLDGVEVARRIRAAGSAVPIVLTSGYLKGPTERGLGNDAVQGFLRKPYTITELVDAIERAVSSPRPESPEPVRFRAT